MTEMFRGRLLTLHVETKRDTEVASFTDLTLDPTCPQICPHPMSTKLVAVQGAWLRLRVAKHQQSAPVWPCKGLWLAQSEVLALRFKDMSGTRSLALEQNAEHAELDL